MQMRNERAKFEPRETLNPHTHRASDRRRESMVALMIVRHQLFFRLMYTGVMDSACARFALNIIDFVLIFIALFPYRGHIHKFTWN